MRFEVHVCIRIILTLLAIAASGAASASVDEGDQALTGVWYDPSDSGQGLELVISIAPDSANRRLLSGAWFTFDAIAGGDTPDATPAGQRWYIVEAEYDADAPAIPFRVYQNSGGVFDAPPVTSAVTVGTGTLTFASCTSGSLDYAFDDGRTGTIPLASLMPNNACGHEGSGEDSGVGNDGAWYDPDLSGQGLFVAWGDQPSPDAMFAGWFTYGPAATSGPRWFTAQGERAPPSFGGGYTANLTIFATTGGAFDQHEPVSTVPVGTMRLSFETCYSGSLDYVFDAGELAGKSGTVDLARLGPAPFDCSFSP